MMPMQSASIQQSPTQQLGAMGIQVPQNLSMALDAILNSPSIPFALRQQFFMLWENVIFGNFTDRDILFLMSKFREWTILLEWYIPEQHWGNLQVYSTEMDEVQLKMDLNLLLNMLEQLYFIQLTRGRGGFTVKEMNTARQVFQAPAEPAKKSGWL
jgi:hypothetical protein